MFGGGTIRPVYTYTNTYTHTHIYLHTYTYTYTHNQDKMYIFGGTPKAIIPQTSIPAYNGTVALSYFTFPTAAEALSQSSSSTTPTGSSHLTSGSSNGSQHTNGSLAASNVTAYGSSVSKFGDIWAFSTSEEVCSLSVCHFVLWYVLSFV
jgi:hypothetical protein